VIDWTYLHPRKNRNGTWARSLSARLAAVACAIAILAATPARAQHAAAASAAAEAGAGQVVGLFMQTCVTYVGNPDGLRKWAQQNGLQPMPADEQQKFLYGLPGKVFDASTRNDKIVLISEDGGSCSALAESANGPAVIEALERAMHSLHVTFTVTLDSEDTQEKALHHREYAAAQGTHQWQMLVSIVKGVARGEVMLTANPG
jgi:hypothetical protein